MKQLFLLEIIPPAGFGGRQAEPLPFLPQCIQQTRNENRQYHYFCRRVANSSPRMPNATAQRTRFGQQPHSPQNASDPTTSLSDGNRTRRQIRAGPNSQRCPPPGDVERFTFPGVSICKMPSLTLVLPVYGQLPVNVNLPLPSFFKPPSAVAGHSEACSAIEQS